MDSPDARWFNVKQVALHLNVSRRLVWTWIASGQLQAKKLGPRTIRIAPEDLERFLDRTQPRG